MEEALEGNPEYFPRRKSSDEDHYGLEKIKERILEFLAAATGKESQGLNPLFRRAPRRGQDFAGDSIAKATGRKFVRMSLGGVRDEAEIRGHRRTYIGACRDKSSR